LKLIDTHAHLQGKEFADDLTNVLTRSREAGVGKIVLIGVNVEDSHRALDVARAHPDKLLVVAGIHPHDAKLWNDRTVDDLRALAQEPEVVGLGEMGLDYHYDFSPRDQQHEVFQRQLELARELNMPIVIHCREAYDDLLDQLEQFYGDFALPADAPPRGVLHCYMGTVEQARRGQDRGFLIGVGGACTFKKAEELHRVVADTPLENIVLETDAPYMTPTPHRGKRNDSSYVPLIAARIAELKATSIEEVAATTTGAAHRLYRL